MIENFGADSVRFFILSDSPPEKDVQWSEQGMKASYKFIQKFWNLNTELEKKLSQKISPTNINKSLDDEISIFTNQIIKKITFNLENFHYNVIIANFHEIYNFFNKVSQTQISDLKNLRENYIKILIVMKPVLPHIISECLFNLNEKNSTIWPKINEKYLEKQSVNVVVQVDGKKRSLVSCKKDISERDLTKIINNKEELKKYFFKKEILKTIYVKNKIINFILK